MTLKQILFKLKKLNVQCQLYFFVVVNHGQNPHDSGHTTGIAALKNTYIHKQKDYIKNICNFVFAY